MKRWKITYTDCGALKSVLYRGEFWGIPDALNRARIATCNVTKAELVEMETPQEIF